MSSALIAASLTSIEDTLSSTWDGQYVVMITGGRAHTFAIAEFRVGFGAELFAPKSLFILADRRRHLSLVLSVIFPRGRGDLEIRALGVEVLLHSSISLANPTAWCYTLVRARLREIVHRSGCVACGMVPRILSAGGLIQGIESGLV